jgi:hypothetical protein
MPERYRIRYACSTDEVLSELQKFADYLKCGPIITLLPSALRGVSARNAGDVEKWQEEIARVLRETPPEGAIAGYWLNLLEEVFRGAAQRLDELCSASCGGLAALQAA